MIVTLITNGSLISEKRAKFLAAHNVQVAVSLDGPEQLHDTERVFVGGQGTHASAVRGFRTLQQCGLQPSVSCTITDQNLPHLLETLEWFIEELGVEGLGFNMLIDVEDAASKRDWTSYMKQASTKLLECFEIARERGVCEDRIMRKVKAFQEGRITPNDCGGCGQQIVIAPSGEVGTCHGFVGSKQYFIDYENDLDPNTHPVWREWRQRSPLSMEQIVRP